MAAREHIGKLSTTSRDRSSDVEGQTRRQVPIVTLVVFAITALCNLGQVVSPEVLVALRRDPAALAAGQWWRGLTPLLVQSDGLLAFVFVMVGLLLVGVVVEGWYGRGCWLVLYLAGGLVGEAAGYAWDPHGAGSSVGVLGLVGGLLVFALWRPDVAMQVGRAHLLGTLALLYTVGLIGALVGADMGGAVLSAVLAAGLASVLIWLVQFKAPARVVAWYVGGVGLLGALVMTALRDIHGPPLLAGLGAALLLLALAPRTLPWRG